MIQETRGHILEILKVNGESTVDEIVEALHRRTEKRVTAATVRHHLDVLRMDGLVEAPAVRRRDRPGRPQYVYHLTDKALDLFPTNYAGLAHSLLDQMHQHLSPQDVNVIIEGAAQQMASSAHIPNVAMEERLQYVVDYLTEQGYQAHWEAAEDREGFVLRTSNCPYEKLVGSHQGVCDLDMHLVANLLGVVPRRIGRIAEGGKSCDYFVPQVTEAVSSLEEI
ncbi:MAG: ArsR family transcriptional regulator [Chloroflexi bacterium]|nr:ArsR family transcriptional regulator [Chloroflexota bacterium]